MFEIAMTMPKDLSGLAALDMRRQLGLTDDHTLFGCIRHSAVVKVDEAFARAHFQPHDFQTARRELHWTDLSLDEIEELGPGMVRIRLRPERVLELWHQANNRLRASQPEPSPAKAIQAVQPCRWIRNLFRSQA